jgi:uncharacterized membrane protein
MGNTDRIDINSIVGSVLRYGVLISAIIMATGVLMILLGLNTPQLPASLTQLVTQNYGRPTLDGRVLIEGVIALKPLFILQLGLLTLLATPIIRVGASILLFVAEKDKIYVAVTVFVLAVLLFSIFFVGPIEAAIS